MGDAKYEIRNTKYDAIVIGGGHNGLVTAAYLAKAGQRVLVLERREVVGGAAVTEEVVPGFRFDSCASGAGWLHPAVTGELDLARHGLEIVRPDPTVFTPLPDGGGLTLRQDPQKTAGAVRRFSEADASRWGAFTARLATLTGFLETVYASPPPRLPDPERRELPSLLKLAAGLRRMGKTEMVEVLRTLPMSVAEFLDEWFESDVLKGTLGASGITGIFQGPRAAGTAAILLHHHVGGRPCVVRSIGLVRGGVGKLSETLAAAALEHGAEIRTGAEVARIVVKDGRATGVALASAGGYPGEEISARRVISNADPRRTFLSLVDPLHLDPGFLRAVQNIRFRGCCAKVNLALGELPDFGVQPDYLRGVISISPDLDYLERAYDDAKYGRPSRRPYLEALIPSLSDPGMAPAGAHVMSVLVQYAPYHLKEGTWDDARREALGEAVVATLAEYAPNIKGVILGSQVLTPLDLEQTYGLTEGNVNHGEMTLDQLFFMRPVPGQAKYRTPIENLYLCGAGTHPGGGVTGRPGYNAAREVLRDVKRDA